MKKHQPLKLKAFLKEHGIKLRALARSDDGLSYGYIRRVVAGEYPVTDRVRAQVRSSLHYLEVPDELFEHDEGDGSSAVA